MSAVLVTGGTGMLGHERKLACEHEIAASGVPHMIQRATHQAAAKASGRLLDAIPFT